MPFVVLAQGAGATTTTTTSALPTCELNFNTATGLVNTITVPAGAGVTLVWSSINAVRGTITGVGAVAPGGSINLSPPSAAQTVFTGVFNDQNGDASQPCTATVYVSAASSNVTTNNATVQTNINGGTLPTYAPKGVSSSGGTTNTGSGSTQPSSIVPCSGTADCNACSLASLAQSIINFAIGLAIPIAAGLFAYAGFKMYASGNAAEERTEAKHIFMNALIGFVIAISGWLIVNTFLHAILSPTLFPGQNSWFTIKCTYSRYGATYFSTIDQILNGLPVGDTSGLAPAGTSGGTAYVCQTGSLQTNSTQAGYGDCVDNSGTVIGAPVLVQTPAGGLTCPAGQSVAGGNCYDDQGNLMGPAQVTPAVTSGGRGVAQCADSNTNCSISALMAQGLNASQAAVMSCIAITENGGNSAGCSGTGPCGTFQVNQANWAQYAPPQCAASVFGSLTAAQNNAACNLQVTATLVKTSGYTPWTCANCNNYAQTCINNYGN